MMNKNLENMKCDELRMMAKDLGIKGYGSKGKGWLIPQIEAVLKAQEEAKKQSQKKEKKAGGKQKEATMIEHDGKTQSIAEWAEELGIPVPTLRGRLRRGWTIEEALKADRKYGSVIEFNGKALTLTEWAKELGIPRATLNGRLNIRKWSVERALHKALLLNA